MEHPAQQTAAVLYELALHGTALELSGPVALLELYRQTLLLHLEKNGPDFSVETAKQVLADMGAALNRLNHQTDNLAALCACARNTVPVRQEAVDLAALLRNVMDAQQSIYRLIGVRLELQYDPDEDWCVSADRTLVERILLNLLTNGLQACHAGQQVVFALQRQGDTVCLTVTDNGCGLPQATSGEAPQPGAGVGLFLCGQFSRLMDWRITVTPLEQGSCVSLRIPAGCANNRFLLRSDVQQTSDLFRLSLVRQLRTLPGLSGLEKI